MSLIDDLLKGKFELACSEIRLKRETGDRLEIAGPGVIELNDEGKFEYAFHISPADYHQMFFSGLGTMLKPGSLVPEEQYFQLTATSYLEGVWTSRVILPRSGGPVGGPGMAGGSMSELRSEKGAQNTGADCATFFLLGELDFPVLEYTQRPEIRKSASSPGTATRDHSSFSIGSEEFVLYREQNHTEFHCRFEAGAIGRNRHRRMQEALGFAACRPIWPAASRLEFDGKLVETLYSSSRLPTDFKVSQPPFHFANLPPDSSAKFFELVSAYYRKVIEHVGEGEHPISQRVSLVMQAIQAYVDVQVLSLAVAAESLIRKAFPDLVAIEPGLKEEIGKFKTLLDQSDLSESLKSRVKKPTDHFLSASGSDLLYTFITKRGMNPKIHDAWKKSRNPVAHGDLIDLLKDDVAGIVDRRNKVLYLCYAIVLGYIGYSGPHTRYDIPGFPPTDWKPFA